MDEDRIRQLEGKVEALTEAVRRLEARLPAGAPAPEDAAPAEAPSPALAAEAATPPSGALDLTGAVSLAGRSFLVVGGAFLIRALTDREVLPRGLGVALGLVFAALWLVLAWRAAARTQRLSATFHGGTAALIGYPLVYESATRLGALSAPVAALVLVAFSGLMLVVAGRHTLRLLAWAGVAGGVAVTGLLLRNTDAPTALCLALLALAVATHVLAELRGWTGPRWIVALVLDVLVLRRVFKAVAAPDAGDVLGTALLLAQVTVLLYLGAVVFRTWARDARAGAFELVQTALVLGVGLATAGRVGDALPWVPTAAGIVALALAGGALVTAARLSEREDRGLDVWFFGVMGLALILSGGPFLVRGWPLTLLWAGLGLAAALLGRRGHTRMLWGFALLLTWAAAGSGGVFEDLRSGFLVSPTDTWAALSLEGGAAVLAALLTYALMATPAPGPVTKGTRVRLLAGAVLLLTVLGIGAAAVHGLRALLGGAQADAGIVVLVRTLVLVAGALGLGLARRLGGPLETGWAAWVALGIGAVKLLVQDLPGGRPSTLFIAFLAFGASVILLPRLIRSTRGPTEGA